MLPPKPSAVWSIAALVAALVFVSLRFFLPTTSIFVLGVIVTGFSGYVFFMSRIHPRIYLGKGIVLIALILSGAVTYMAFGDLAHAYMWRRVFQLTGRQAVFEDPVEKWKVSYPRKWSHEEQRISGTVSHVFRPSKVTPTVFFSITSRPNVGTNDINLIVEGFFLNLPKGASTDILERRPLALPSGVPAYSVVYSEAGRRVPVKNRIVFILEKSHLYMLTVGASPLWFDRHQEYFNQLISSFELPSA